MKTFIGFVVRGVLLLAGLVFVASLLAGALLLLAVWFVRALWAKLTGQPVVPWTFQVNRQAMMDRFYRAPGSGGVSPRGEVIDADVVDVEVKSIRPPGG